MVNKAWKQEEKRLKVQIEKLNESLRIERQSKTEIEKLDKDLEDDRNIKKPRTGVVARFMRLIGRNRTTSG